MCTALSERELLGRTFASYLCTIAMNSLGSLHVSWPRLLCSLTLVQRLRTYGTAAGSDCVGGWGPVWGRWLMGLNLLHNLMWAW